MFVEGSQKQSFFLQTLIYGICRDGSKNYNIRACEHMILVQLRIGARHTIYAPLNMATHCAANMAYLLRTKEGSLFMVGESDKL